MSSLPDRLRCRVCGQIMERVNATFKDDPALHVVAMVCPSCCLLPTLSGTPYRDVSTGAWFPLEFYYEA